MASEAQPDAEDADAASIALALQLQEEEERYFALQQAAVVPDGADLQLTCEHPEGGDEHLRGERGARPERKR